MITLIFTITAILITVFGIVANRSKCFTDSGPTKTFFIWLVTGIFLIAGSLIQPLTLERVDAGHVGIKVQLIGDSRGVSKYEYKTGWVVYNDWTEDLFEFPTFQQHIDYAPQYVITKGGFQTVIKPSFNYSLNPGAIGDMFQNLRRPLKEIEAQWLMNAIISSVNDVSNTWTVDDVFNNREKFEAAIIHEATKRTSKWFTISQLRTNITPPDALKRSIEEKTQAIQEVQVAENRKRVAVAEAQTKIAVARGDSAQAVIAASGRAEAIKREQLQITPIYIEYMKAKSWDGTLPQTMLGSQTPFILGR